jgi:hypothetical protein
MKHNVTIKATGLSPEEVQKLIDSLDTPNYKVAIKPVLRQTDVSGSLLAVEALDLLNKVHQTLAKSEISQVYYTHISRDLIDIKKRIKGFLSSNDR